MKHTKGPWRKSGSGVKSDTRQICIQSIKDDECNANQNLIAAAPEMLEALESVLQFTQSLDSSNGLMDLETYLEKLIKKAKGE